MILFLRAFDALNSTSPVAKGLKAPLRPHTFEYQREAMEAAGQDLMDLQLESGRPVVQDGRRMSVISLAFTLKSVVMLAESIFDSQLCRWVQIVPRVCARLKTKESAKQHKR